MKKAYVYILFSFSASILDAQTITRQYFITDILGRDDKGWLTEDRLREKYNWNPSNPIKISVLGGGRLENWISFHLRRAAIFQGTFHTRQTTLNTLGYGNLTVNTGLTIEEINAQIARKPPVTDTPFFTIIFYDPADTKMADIRYLQTLPEMKHVVFQVASTFNALEGGMGDDLTKKRTSSKQGPNLVGMLSAAAQGEEAAISCAGATIFRKYFMYPISLLHGLEPKIKMAPKTGFAAIHWDTIAQIRDGKITLTADDVKKIGVGLHQDIVVTSGYGDLRKQGQQRQMPIALKPDGKTVDTNKTQIISQVFTAAFNTRYERQQAGDKPLSQSIIDLSKILLDGSYEGTVKVAFYGGQPKVMLTLMGSGAFQNDVGWAYDALNRNEVKKFIKEKGMQVILIYRPDKPRTKAELGFEPVRTAEGDKLFLENLFKLADEINDTHFVADPQLKNDIHTYVDESYKLAGLVGVNRGKKQAIVKSLSPKRREERSDVDELGLNDLCKKLQCKKSPTRKQIEDYQELTQQVISKSQYVSLLAKKLQRYFPKPLSKAPEKKPKPLEDDTELITQLTNLQKKLRTLETTLRR